jgi:hypothetical protein
MGCRGLCGRLTLPAPPFVPPQGVPRDLPLTYSHLLRGSSSSSYSSSTAPAPSGPWLDSLAPVRLAEVLGREYIGKPRIPLTRAELEGEVTLFPEEQAPKPSFAHAASADGGGAGGGGGGGGGVLKLKLGPPSSSSSSLTSLASAAPTPALPTPSPAPPVRHVSPPSMEALRAEDDVVALFESREFSAAAEPAVSERFQGEILHHALQKLRGMRWSSWPFGDGNPFTLKITKSNQADLGVPEYSSFVKNPMDFTRMGERLVERRYPGPDPFFADARLVVYNAKFYNGPHRPNAVFPDPRTTPGLDQAAFGPQSVYGMAFDVEAALDAMEGRVRACHTQLTRLVRRGLAVDMVRGMVKGGGAAAQNPLLLRYIDPAFQAALAAATKEWAEVHGINIVR